MALKRKASETDLLSELMATMDHVSSPARSDWFRISFEAALLGCNDQLVERLIKAAPDVVPGMRTRQGLSALCAAAARGNLAVIGMVLKAGVDLDETSGADQNTALMCAISYRHDDAARLLISERASVHVLNRHHSSALHHAASFGSPEMVGDLLLAGANRGTQDISGHTPLHEAVRSRRSKIASVLISGADDGRAIVNAANIHGNSPLVSAVLNDSEGMVRLLLKAGADTKVTYVYADVKYPLLYLTRKKLRMTELLVSHGASVHRETGEREGFSALHWAAISGCPDVLRHLAGNGFRLEKKFYVLEMGGTKFYRGTALHLAVLHGKDRRGCVDVLIEKGSNVNARDWAGFTPLAALCEAFTGSGVGWRVDVATALLTAGADETISNEHNKTPIELLGEGVDPNGVLRGLLCRASIWRRRKLWILLRSRRGEGVDLLRRSKLGTVTQRLIAIGEEGVFRHVMSFV